MLIRSDKIPKVPVTKETELISRQTKVSSLPTYMAQQTSNASGRSSLDQSSIFKSKPLKDNLEKQFIIQSRGSHLQTPNTQLASDRKQLTHINNVLPSR